MAGNGPTSKPMTTNEERDFVREIEQFIQTTVIHVTQAIIAKDQNMVNEIRKAAIAFLVPLHQISDQKVEVFDVMTGMGTIALNSCMHFVVNGIASETAYYFALLFIKEKLDACIRDQEERLGQHQGNTPIRPESSSNN